MLRFALPRAGRATIQIFDVAGREVNTLFDEAASTGEHEVAWDGRDGHGRGVAPVVYLARLRTEQGVAARRVVRVR